MHWLDCINCTTQKQRTKMVSAHWFCMLLPPHTLMTTPICIVMVIRSAITAKWKTNKKKKGWSRHKTNYSSTPTPTTTTTMTLDGNVFATEPWWCKSFEPLTCLIVLLWRRLSVHVYVSLCRCELCSVFLQKKFYKCFISLCRKIFSSMYDVCSAASIKLHNLYLHYTDNCVQCTFGVEFYLWKVPW